MLCCWNGLLFRAIVVANNIVVVSREVGQRLFCGRFRVLWYFGMGIFGLLQLQ